ncbi:MAG TPA: type II toxin-antitoxin system HipA family toxin YjjJ [Solimonas sp.]
MNHAETLLTLLQRGPRTAAEMARALALSQPTIARALQRVAPRIVRMGRARATRYALLRALSPETPPQAYPIWRVSERGAPQQIGTLSPIQPAGYWYEDARHPQASRFHEDLPWFLQGLRPQGFLGRIVARQLSQNGYPADLRIWTADHVLRALTDAATHDHIGNCIVGQRAIDQYRHDQRLALAPGVPQALSLRLAHYGRAAENLLNDGLPGSSAGGDQPKFLASVHDPQDDSRRAVIVKFSPPLDTEAGQRWGDLLRMESLALATLREALNLPAATATWMTDGHRAYLEVDRFDRTDAHGRRDVVSLSILDAEFVGHGDGWPRVVEALVAQQLLHPDALTGARILTAFSELIGNNDRHLGNLSVIDTPGPTAHLAPAYDILPMLYAPGHHGLRHSAMDETHRAQAERALHALPDEWAPRVTEAARAFWNRCAADSHIGDAMRAISAQNAQWVPARSRPH